MTTTQGAYAKAFALYRAVLAAGLDVGTMKTLETHRGVAWSTTLLVGKKVVLEASNDGNGGPDDVRPPYGKTDDQRQSNQAAGKAATEKLLAMPEVKEFFIDFWITVASYGKTGEELEAKIAEIRANPPATTEDQIGNLIATLAETKKFVASIKRMAGKQLAWAEKHHSFGNYTKVKTADTSGSRAYAQAKWPEKFVDFQGFMTDLIKGL